MDISSSSCCSRSNPCRAQHGVDTAVGAARTHRADKAKALGGMLHASIISSSSGSSSTTSSWLAQQPQCYSTAVRCCMSPPTPRTHQTYISYKMPHPFLLPGAGKTHTMAGSRASYAARGLIPRVISALLARLGAAPGLAAWSVSVSYLEIYNEALYDLLDLTAQPQELALYEDGRGRVQVRGLVGLVGIYNTGYRREVACRNLQEHALESSVHLQQQQQQVLKDGGTSSCNAMTTMFRCCWTSDF